VQRAIGIVTHQLAEQAVGRLVQVRSWPAGMWLRGDGARCTVLAEHFLDKRETHAEQVRQGTLRAEPPFIRMENLLP
jgi:hypothetical protein